MQLYWCLLFISLETPAISFHIMFRASFQMPFNWGRAVWSWQRLKQPKSALQRLPSNAKNCLFASCLLGYATLLLQASSGKCHQEKEQTPTDHRALEFQLRSQSRFMQRRRRLLQSAGTRDGRDKTHHPMPRGRISPTKTIPAIQHWTIIFELNLTYI